MSRIRTHRSPPGRRTVLPPEVDPATARFALDSPNGKDRRRSEPSTTRAPAPARRGRRVLWGTVAGLAAIAAIAALVAVWVAASASDDEASGATAVASTQPPTVASVVTSTTEPATTTTTIVADLVVLNTPTLQSTYVQDPSQLSGDPGFTRLDPAVLTVECRPSGCVLLGLGPSGSRISESGGGFTGGFETPVPGDNPACGSIRSTVDLQVAERQVIGGLSVPSRLVGRVETRWDSNIIRQGISTFECVGFSNVLGVNAIVFQG